MSHGTLVIGAMFLAFVVFIAARGELATYVELLV